jgi:hypothetical protein
VINVFNRKKILTSPSMEDLGRVKQILGQGGIPYEVKTERARGAICTSMDVASYRQFNLPYKDGYTATFVYYVYIRRRDYERAQGLGC